LVNASRLAKIKRRNDVVEKIKDDARTKLASSSSNPKYGELMTALIVQGLILLKESEVTVRCRKEDEQLVLGLLGNAQAEYKKVMKRDTSLDVDVVLKVDNSEYLPAGPSSSTVGFSW
jgi:vacuolar-type H+-ATPase subunit E/Vma4